MGIKDFHPVQFCKVLWKETGIKQFCICYYTKDTLYLFVQIILRIFSKYMQITLPKFENKSRVYY